MRKAGAVRRTMTGDDLFEQIGAFLATHGLSPDPDHYRFAYAALADPASAFAQRVAALTDGGVRLGRHDIERLGHVVHEGGAPLATRAEPTADDSTERLAAATRETVDGLAQMMRTMTDETRDFGADLAASAAAIERVATIEQIDKVARITSTMMDRVRDAENRLARADEETQALRDKLAEAHMAARTDPLTGLSNRRAFDEAFADRQNRPGPWCLALIDIDRFKQVNDNNGHAVGDRVLAAIAQLLAQRFPDDLVARHGGEEFVVLLHGKDLTAATALIDEARYAVASKRFRTRDTDRPLGQITFSAGVTAIRARDDAEGAIARADRMLYTAKAGGRDQVCAA